MQIVSVNCGTDSNKHPKSKAVKDISEAYRLVRCHDPEELNYVVVTIHLVKDGLHPEAFSEMLADVFNPAAVIHQRQQEKERQCWPD